jgi:nitroreductase
MPDAPRATPAALPLLEGIATTRAIRRYRDEPIPDEDLAAMFFAATRAPQGSNRQGFRFVVLRDGPRAAEARRLLQAGATRLWGGKREKDGYDAGSGAQEASPKARMARTMQHFSDHFGEAPVIVLACLWLHRQASLEMGGSVYPAVQNLLLAARQLGYGGVITGVHGYCDQDRLRALLGIPPPEQVAIAATVPLGRPLGGHGPVRRRPLREVVYDDGWGEEAPWAHDPPGSRFTSPGPPSGLRV